MRKIIIAALLAIVVSGCDQNKNYQVHTVGVVKDASVVPTSMNESIKTQIKCDSLFFVVNGLPTVKIGYEIKGQFDGNQLVVIYDANGNGFNILK